jgi:alpha-beta hydrolase superfamily lysophospholipase
MTGAPPYEGAFRAWAERRGVRWQTLRIARAAAGGEAVAHRLRPPGAARARVLAVHGAGNDALFAMVSLFKALLERDVEVFAFDVDGHGRDSTTRLDVAAVRGAVPAALEAARALQPELPVHGMGVSLGGALLLRAMADRPGAFASGALLCAPLQVHLSRRAMTAEIGIPLLRVLWRERAHYGTTGLIPSFGPFKRGLYPLRLAEPRPGAFGYVETINELLASFDLERAAGAVRAPTLLVYGAKDRMVPPEQGERLAARITGSRLMMLPGETHLSAPLARAAMRVVLEQCAG